MFAFFTRADPRNCSDFEERRCKLAYSNLESMVYVQTKSSSVVQRIEHLTPCQKLPHRLIPRRISLSVTSELFVAEHRE